MSTFSRRAFLGRIAAFTGSLAVPPALASRLAAQTFALPATGVARGVVFHDRDRSGVRGDNPGVANVLVSNGREVVRTDAQGRYALLIDGDCVLFISKPSGWMTPVNAHQLPQFYRIHQPNGSPPQKFPGIAPTRALPASVDFALRPQSESDRFDVVLFGDPQPRNEREIDFTRRDVLADVKAELSSVNAAFGISLGDEMFDDLSLYDSLNGSISELGLPWYNVLGNHDMNHDTPDDRHAAETFKRVFGPTYYSFDYGQVHFVVLDDVIWLGKSAEGRGHYTGGFGPRQLTWLRNDLSLVPRDKLVVVTMHIPPTTGELQDDDRRFRAADQRRLLSILSERPHTFSISAHTHLQRHDFMGPESGWTGAGRHHHLNHATVCGCWWRGEPMADGVPHATMADGTPNGYSILSFDGARYSIRFKAARLPASEQMAIHAPSEIPLAQVAATTIAANVFAGSDRSRVEMRVNDAPWQTMRQVRREDPGYAALKAAELAQTARGVNPPGRPLPEPALCDHLWEAALPALAPGEHALQVRTTDVWGQSAQSQKTIRVV